MMTISKTRTILSTGFVRRQSYRLASLISEPASQFFLSPSDQGGVETTTFWSPRVVFGGDEIPVIIDQGSVGVDKNGVITSCSQGESKDEAAARANWFVDLTRFDSSSSSNCCLSPGLIDVHTHISSLGRNWEGYTTATQAAAAGGITTIIGMPLNSLPPSCSAEIVDQELEFAHSQSDLYVDVGLWGGVLPETASKTDQLSELLSHPYVLGLKAFLSPLPPGAGYQAVSREQLKDIAKLCGSFQKPILVHSELMTVEDLEQSMESAYPADGTNDNSFDAHIKSRPPQWEQEAVKLVIECTNYCDMHVVHLSDGIGCIPLIEKAKEEIQNANGSRRRLTVETCPHYILLDSNQLRDGDTRAKCFPPIREPEQREKLWHGLSSGLIDIIASDHSPCEPFMRQSSIRNAWGGLTGLQYQLQASWTAAKRYYDGIDESHMAKWWGSNPAKLIGMSDRGSIEIGKQADFVL